jgi:C4-type Zn-finger protein
MLVAKTFGEMRMEAMQNAGKMECPNCGCHQFDTISTTRNNNYIRRRKVCRHCGRKVSTAEAIVPDYKRF